MSRPAVAGLCVVALVAGFVAGRVVERNAGVTVTVDKTVERAVVVPAQHIGSASDARGAGPLDLAGVRSVRREGLLSTTIVTTHPWRDSLLRGGRVGLSILYDVDANGTPDRRDVAFLLHGRLASWISSFGQGVQGADVTRRSATTITVARAVAPFYSASGQGDLLTTSPIGIAVVARWPGGGDRVPDHGWILVPAPAR